MLRLILMRHADAEAARGRDDHARPLSRTGRREADAAGTNLASANFVPDLALASDSVRTSETLDRVLAAFPTALPHRRLASLYGATPNTMLATLRAVPQNVGTVLLIGHNPGVGDLARTLAEAGDPRDLQALRAHFPTACWAVLACEGGSWSEIAPGRLERLHGAKHG